MSLPLLLMLTANTMASQIINYQCCVLGRMGVIKCKTMNIYTMNKDTQILDKKKKDSLPEIMAYCTQLACNGTM